MSTTGRIASAAQIAGSLVCPYLIPLVLFIGGNSFRQSVCCDSGSAATGARSAYKAVTSKCIDFVPLAPVAFTWIMELHAIIYSIAIDDFYMLLANTIFFCMDGSLLAMFFIFPNDRPHFKVEISVQ
ncbi:hypothetical protein Y032_0519g2836 [Ancylostoma ceylanicum]|uniref:Uncharacterized protein n=1 Tax=Ancylostoma ceylanicum TaxID=53326 RepID=A0A016WSG0_9BILA|nr:hypothetical protein Y032_0519g2836 [Ancylostoma ceylanicum]